jgi:hypothetical protein
MNLVIVLLIIGAQIAYRWISAARPTEVQVWDACINR